MALEIERKFRIWADPADWPTPSFDVMAAWDVWQAYLTAPGAQPEVRVRKLRQIDETSIGDVPPRPQLDDDEAEIVVRRLAVKIEIQTSTAGALSRHEVEPAIDEPDFVALWRICEGRRLEKLRVEYMVGLPSGHRVVIVDRFRGHLDGLILAEIEFADWETSTQFEPPGFLGTEVTHDRRYRNAALAAAGRPPAP